MTSRISAPSKFNTTASSALVASRPAVGGADGGGGAVASSWAITIVPCTSRAMAAVSSVITLLPIVSPFVFFLFLSSLAIRLHLHCCRLLRSRQHSRYVLRLPHVQLCDEFAVSAVASVGYCRARLVLPPVPPVVVRLV